METDNDKLITIYLNSNLKNFYNKFGTIIYSNIIPRIGETISIGEDFIVKDVGYTFKNSRIEEVVLTIEKKA